MKLLIISDLHIGNNGSLFLWDDKQFIDKMCDIISKYEIDATILNGDIYELYKFSMEQIKQDHKSLYDFLDQFVYIRGNHDWKNKFGIKRFEFLNKNKQRILITHGHQADLIDGTKFGRFISSIVLKILKYFSLNMSIVKKIYHTMMSEETEIIGRKYNRLKYLNYSIKLFKSYDVVILGHTHKQEVLKTFDNETKKLYINSGTCIQNKFQAVVFDTETLAYILIKERAA